MKREAEILSAFERLGFKPREHQAEFVDKIVSAFVDGDKKHVVLNAPTGTGKSIIGAVVADVVHAVKYPTKKNEASFMLTATNVLAQQYANTFEKVSQSLDPYTFLVVKGANNYGCEALSVAEAVNAESCAYTQYKKDPEEFQKQLRSCYACEYLEMKEARKISRHMITNYAYYFVERMYVQMLSARTMTVWDEAHLINDIFSEHNTIYISEKRIKTMMEEIKDIPLGTLGIDVYKVLKKIRDALEFGGIDDSNYHEYLSELHMEVYLPVRDAAKREAEGAIRNIGEYLKFMRLHKKYFGLGCKIDDLHKYKYDHVFEYNFKECEATVKPIFVAEMFNQLVNSDHNLFMSATVSDAFMKQTLNLDPEETEFIQLPPTFPPENKKIIFYAPQNLNYRSLQEEETVKVLQKQVETIVRKHAAEGEKGIVLTPSFKLTYAICNTLIWEGKAFETFEHKQGEKLAPLLASFKAYAGGAAVLVSPSLFEGIDLPGDLSRFQIFVKAPFPSLGEKRMKHILDKYPAVYNLITIMKIVQGVGRSVRSPDDYAATYALDTNLQRLFNSSANVWKNEFTVNYTKFI